MDARINRFMRSRLVWPAVVVFALLTVVATEIAYRTARHSAAQAVEINTARWAIHRLQLAAADLDSSWRGGVKSGDAALREHYAAARDAMHKQLDSLGERYTGADEALRADFERVVRMYTARVDEMDRVMRLRDAGDIAGSNAALDLVGAKHFGGQPEPTVRALLTREVAALREEQSRFFGALSFGRWSVLALTLAALIAVGAFRHASLRLDSQREEQRRTLELERERLESTVAQRTGELRALASHLQTAVEDERATLARELHDELGALLTAAKLDVARLKSKLTPGSEPDARLAHLNAMLNDGIALKRRIIESLRPSALANLGLVPALEILVRETQDRLGVPIEANLVPVPASAEAALTVYRFVQEALTNVARHAHARHARVSLAAHDGHIRVDVHDDGVGFDAAGVAVGAHGLSGMRFRVESLGGHMTVKSRKGDTLLTATIPMTADALAVSHRM